MLKRQVEVGRDLRKAGDGVEQPVVGGVGVAVEHAHPVDAVDGADGLEQLGQQVVAVAEVAAVARGVLRDERQLRDAIFCKAAAFGDDVVERARRIAAADQRDRAVGAAVVAAVGNLDVGGERRRGQHARRLQKPRAVGGVAGAMAAFRVGEHFVEPGVVGHAHDAVDFGDLVEQRVRIALREAARDEQPLQAAGLFVLRHFKDGVDGFLLGRLDEAAGVDEDRVGLGRIGDDLHAARAQHPQQVFRIHAILGAAQRDQADLFQRLTHKFSPISVS